MIYRFKTKDSPDANGRHPIAGEQKWTVYFPTEDGGRVYVEMGRKGREAMLSMLKQEDEDDRDLTDEEAQVAYDTATPVPLTEERIQEIVNYATGKCDRCEGSGKAIGADRPFEYSGPGTYPGPCPKCKGTGVAKNSVR